VVKIVLKTPKDFLDIVGKPLGVSKWKLVTQKEINKFASSTEDFQWIHVNDKRAKKESPYKSTIAHGYYSLSLIPKFVNEIWQCKKMSLILNYGADRIRFISPVLCNDYIRASILVKDAKSYKGGILLTSNTTIEIKNKKKPALIADTLSLLYY